MKLTVLVHGALGRMGMIIVEKIEQEQLWNCVKVDHKLYSNQDENEYSKLSDVPTDKNIDLVIDFSTANSFSSVIDWCLSRSCGLVSGTTGISLEDEVLLKKLALIQPVLWSSNMSLGIALFKKLIQQLKPLKNEFDFQIEEIHHNKKIDAPSGTAKTLQQTLEQTINGQTIPKPLSIRGGGVFGVHKLWALSDDEVLSIEHQALNREVFAQGAIRCSHWLLNHLTPGFYSVEDTLN